MLASKMKKFADWFLTRNDDESSQKGTFNKQENISKNVRRTPVVFYYGEKELASNRYDFDDSGDWDAFQRELDGLADEPLEDIIGNQPSSSGVKKVHPWREKNLTKEEFIESIIAQALEEGQASYNELWEEGKEDEAFALAEKCRTFESMIKNGEIPLENFGYVPPKPPALKDLMIKILALGEEVSQLTRSRDKEKKTIRRLEKEVDAQKATARYRKGVLEVHLKRIRTSRKGKSIFE